MSLKQDSISVSSKKNTTTNGDTFVMMILYTLYKLIFKDQADADVACKEINGPNFRATLVLTA